MPVHLRASLTHTFAYSVTPRGNLSTGMFLNSGRKPANQASRQWWPSLLFIIQLFISSHYLFLVHKTVRTHTGTQGLGKLYYMYIITFNSHILCNQSLELFLYTCVYVQHLYQLLLATSLFSLKKDEIVDSLYNRLNLAALQGSLESSCTSQEKRSRLYRQK